MMTITVNGKEQKMTAPLSVEELLGSLSLDALRVAVELNQEILDRESFAATTLEGGDTLEIVQFVGGG